MITDTQKLYINCYLILIQTVGELELLILELYCIDMVLEWCG